MRHLDEVFDALGRSPFRQRFTLGPRERAYLESKGFETILDHGRHFIASRLAPAYPANDGKQTPMSGHPVFVAQHATASCCRSCLEKWHYIGRGRELDAQERAHVLQAIERWLSKEMR